MYCIPYPERTALHSPIRHSFCLQDSIWAHTLPCSSAALPMQWQDDRLCVFVRVRVSLWRCCAMRHISTWFPPYFLSSSVCKPEYFKLNWCMVSSFHDTMGFNISQTFALSLSHVMSAAVQPVSCSPRPQQLTTVQTRTAWAHTACKYKAKTFCFISYRRCSAT